MAKKRYSYIKHPFSTDGWYSFVLGIAAFFMTLFILVSSVRSDGSVPLFHAAMGFSAILFSVTGLIFTMESFRQKQKNYLFAILGGILALAVLVVWVLLLTVVK